VQQSQSHLRIGATRENRKMEKCTLLNLFWKLFLNNSVYIWVNTCLPGLRDEKLLIYVFSVTEKKNNFQFYAGRSNVHIQQCCCCCKQTKWRKRHQENWMKLIIFSSKAFWVHMTTSNRCTRMCVLAIFLFWCVIYLCVLKILKYMCCHPCCHPFCVF